jgi:hypothetical protein
MKWTIRIELTPDGNKPMTCDVGTITRPIDDLSPEQIGLTLEEGQQILRRVQVEMISSQVHAFALCRRCAHRGMRHSIAARAVDAGDAVHYQRSRVLARWPGVSA